MGCRAWEGGDLQHAVNGHPVAAQRARRQHGHQVEEEVGLPLKLLGQLLTERRLERGRRRRRHAVPAFRLAPVVVVDCASKACTQKCCESRR